MYMQLNKEFFKTYHILCKNSPFEYLNIEYKVYEIKIDNYDF